MRIPEQDIAAIQAFGYTEDEARFLYLVATHSGYFLQRQFLEFSGAKWGYRTNHFAEKLQSRGHAYWREYQGARRVYHLFSKPIYTAIGKENIRNRRRHSAQFIRNRLVLLDFVLANQEHDYLETEQQKVSYFCEKLQIPKKDLPAKSYGGGSGTEPTVRYFVDKYPLFLDGSDDSSAPVVTLSYVDSGYAGVAGFENHLNAYNPLFRHLTDFRFLYLANSTAQFNRAEERFSTLVTAPLLRDTSAEFLRYFQYRKVWEARKYGLFADEQIEWLNEATRGWKGECFEALYSSWLSGLSAEAVRQEFAKAEPPKRIQFVTYLVKISRFAERASRNGGEAHFSPLLQARTFFASGRAGSEVGER